MRKKNTTLTLGGNSVMNFKGNFLNFLLDQLADIDQLSFKKMLGGIGFYRDGLLFGVISGGKLRLRLVGKKEQCEHTTNGEIEISTHGSDDTPYCAVPEDVLHDKSTLLEWAQIAYSDAKEKQQA
ncbi:MAG: TfoX/Sxy family protein [Bacteroidota bacterium]